MPTAPPAAAARLPYQPGLDNLRGLAALGICLYHFGAGLLPERETVEFIKTMVTPGYLGPIVFFAISGYIIPYSLFRRDYQFRRFGSYIKRRLIRIDLPAYVAILLTLLVWTIDDKLIRHGDYFLAKVSVPMLVHNFLFTVPYTSYGWVIGAFWTLVIELQFYLLMGFLFPLISTGARAGWWFAGAFLGLSGLFWLFSPQFLLPAYAPLLALGGAVVLWQQQRISLPACLACLLVFGALTACNIDRLNAGTGLQSAVTGLLTIGAILCVTWRIPGLAFIGTISYSFYLTHMLVGRTAEFIAYHLNPPSSDLHRALNLAVCVLAAIGFGTLFHYGVERPCIHLARRLGGGG